MLDARLGGPVQHDGFELKRLLAALGLFGTALACCAGVGGGGGNDGSGIVNSLLGRSRGEHPFTPHEYLAPSYEQPKAAICPTFADGDTSFARFLVPVLDSIRNSSGRFADSAFAGADLHATAFIMPTQVGVAAAHMTLDDLRGIAHRWATYELGSHGPASQRLGAVGMDGSGNGVSYDGVTGMQVAFLDSVLGGYQDSMETWGFPRFRSDGATNWSSQLGMQEIWKRHGYFQRGTLGMNVTRDQAAVGWGAQLLTAQQRNCNEFIPAVFGRFTVGFSGFHLMGEVFHDYDIGVRSAFDRSGIDSPGVTDSLKIYTDMACQLSGIAFPTFHNIVPNGTGSGIEIEEDEMYDLIYYWASRVHEGILDVLTFEQGVARMRAIRDGNVIPNYNMMRLADSRVTSAVTSSILCPIGFIPPFGNAGTGQNGLYGATADTFVAVGGTATNWKVLDLGVTDTISAAFTLRDGDTDSLTYGMADPEGNIILIESGQANSSTLPVVLQAQGSRARYLFLAIQSMALTNPSPQGWASDFHISIKAGQFTEVKEDNVNQGLAAYEVMTWLVGPRGNNPPAYGNYAMQRSRVRPQFDPTVGDTASAGIPVTTWLDGGPLFNTSGGWTHWNASFELPVYVYNHRLGGNAWDITTHYGNRTSMTAVGSAGDDHDDNWQPIDWWCRPFNSYFYIPVNDCTDFVYCSISVERISTVMTANAAFAILNVAASPMR